MEIYFAREGNNYLWRERLFSPSKSRAVGNERSSRGKTLVGVEKKPYLCTAKFNQPHPGRRTSNGCAEAKSSHGQSPRPCEPRFV